VEMSDSVIRDAVIQIVSAISNHLWDRDVIYRALNAAARIVCVPKAKACIMPYLPHIFKAMETHLPDEEVQWCGCVALSHLAADNKDLDVVVSFGLVAVVRRAIEAHPSSILVNRACCSVVAILTEAEMDSNEWGDWDVVGMLKRAKGILTGDRAGSRWVAVALRKL